MGCASWPDGSHEAAAATATRKRRGERAQSTQQSSTRAPAAAAAAAASRSAVATPEEQAGQERRDRWKGQGRGKAARLRRSRARWDGTRFGERGASDSDKKARDSRAQHLLVLFAAVQSCTMLRKRTAFQVSIHTLSLLFFLPPVHCSKVHGRGLQNAVPERGGTVGQRPVTGKLQPPSCSSSQISPSAPVPCRFALTTKV